MVPPLSHDDHGHHHGHGHATTPHEPWVVWVPLVLLAIPSVVIGCPVHDDPADVFGDFFKDAIVVDGAPPCDEGTGEWIPRCGGHGARLRSPPPPFWLAVASWWPVCVVSTSSPGSRRRSGEAFAHRQVENKYYGLDQREPDRFAGGARIGVGLWKGGDQAVIDGC